MLCFDFGIEVQESVSTNFTLTLDPSSSSPSPSIFYFLKKSSQVGIVLGTLDLISQQHHYCFSTAPTTIL